MKQRTLIISLVVAIGLLIGLSALLHSNRRSALIGNGTEALTLKYSNGRLQVAPGVEFVLALGSAVSTINAADLERLKAAGVKVDSIGCLAWARMLDGTGYMVTKRYLLSFDSTALQPPLQRLPMFPARAGEPSIMGCDVLQHFALEYRPTHADTTITIHSQAPEGYQYLADLDAPATVTSLLGLGHGYYLDLLIGGEPRPFKVETGIANAHLKLPLADTISIDSPLQTRALTTAYESVDMRYSDNMWVRLGDRAGSHPAYFGTWRESAPYSVNPFNFYSQNVLLDFPNRRIGLLPHTPTLTSH